VSDGRDVTIPCGAFALEAHVTRRPGEAWAIVCHPHPAFGGRMHNPLVVALADALDDAGLSTVRFNFRGIDGSGGTPTGGLLEHEDVRAVADYCRAAGASRLALVGYSFGALMALEAIARGERPDGFAAVGFPTTIVGDHPDRVARVAGAMQSGVPSLFVAGDQDQFCELPRLRHWLSRAPHAQLVVEPGVDHFPSGTVAARICSTVAGFVRRNSEA
jgi:alpha/beta superfamily hydrolase